MQFQDWHWKHHRPVKFDENNNVVAWYQDISTRWIGTEYVKKYIEVQHRYGMKSIFCQNSDGQIDEVYSISAGLDYPGIGPEHAWLHDTGRAQYVPVTDDEAVDAFEYLARTEGIICAIESAHAVAHVKKIAPAMSSDDIIIVCLSGRGDKDVAAIARYRGIDLHE